jgi:hypothetical protein
LIFWLSIRIAVAHQPARGVQGRPSTHREHTCSVLADPARNTRRNRVDIPLGRGNSNIALLAAKLMSFD